MTKTIELIKKHTQEYNEYMSKNGGYSFHRFTDGSVHFIGSIFVTKNIAKETDISPLRPVRKLERLIKASMHDDALVTINDFISFRGHDMILGETEITLYNSSVRIEYTGILSVEVDYNHELKKIMIAIQKGRFGDTVFINGVKISTHDLVLLEQELMYFTGGNEPHGVYMKYSDIDLIVDIAGYIIFGGSEKC